MKRAIAALMLAGCASTTPDPVRPTREPPGQSDVEPSTTKALEARPPGEECHATFRSTGDDRADVSRLARGCGSGERLGDTRTGEQAAEGPVAKFVFAGQARTCYRVFAVGGDGVGELDSMLRGPDGRPLVRDESAGPVAVMPRATPVCLAADGVYTIEVSVARGRGRFSVELWKQ